MADTRARSRSDRKMNLLYLIPICVLVLVLLLFRTVLLIGYVPSESMEPTLEKNSYLLATRIYRDIEVGDIIIFEHGGQVLVKRVAACGGETVTIDGQSRTVPDKCYFVLGDNAEHSYDSRYWDDPFAQADSVIAKALFQKAAP